MAQLDDGEFYGRAAAGDMTREAANGAADMIDGWQTVRAELQRSPLDARPLVPRWDTEWKTFVTARAIDDLRNLGGRYAAQADAIEAVSQGRTEFDTEGAWLQPVVDLLHAEQQRLNCPPHTG